MSVDPSTLGIKTLPMLRGSVEWPVGDGSRIGLSSWRVNPMKLGCLVRADSTDEIALTSGVGQFGTGDYVMACTEVAYGQSGYYVPDMTRIARIVAVDDANYEITLDRSLTLATGDFLMNLATDGSISPFVSPNFDGAGFSIYTDNTGQIEISSTFVLTSLHGHYRMWLESGLQVVDLLLLDSNGNARLVEPFVKTELEIV